MAFPEPHFGYQPSLVEEEPKCRPVHDGMGDGVASVPFAE